MGWIAFFALAAVVLIAGVALCRNWIAPDIRHQHPVATK
jgi:hypothetical protein